MKRAGTLTAHGRRWPLYERRKITAYGVVMEVFLSPKDRAEKERLDKEAMKAWLAS